MEERGIGSGAEESTEEDGKGGGRGLGAEGEGAWVM